MSRNITQISSRGFTIRKIIPRQIAENYFNGLYDNRQLPCLKIRSSSALIKLGKEIGKDNSSEIYRFIDKSNNSQSILTTNHAFYTYMLNMQNGKSVDKPILKCKYCKRNITKTPIGLPVSMILKGSETHFIVSDVFCDFGCAYSYVKRKNGENRYFKDSLYMNSEQLLYAMYYQMYPDRSGKSIKDKNDWELLRENGGPLTDEEFDSDAALYVSIPSVVTLPCKKQYIKLSTKN